MVVVNRLCLGQTLVSNAFIDKFLAPADGVFVKVYLLLLRHLDEENLSLEGLAAMLGITEKEVMKALFYWEEQGLISIELDGGRLVTLAVNSPVMDGAGINCHQDAAGKAAPAEKPVPEKAAGQVTALPAAMADQELKQLLYVTEKFLGRTLTKSDITFINWLREDMSFSVDLIEYLIEYCVDRGHVKLSYIKAVAIGWKDEGVHTVEEARTQVKKFDEGTVKPMKTASSRAHNFPERTTDLNALLAEELRNGTK